MLECYGYTLREAFGVLELPMDASANDVKKQYKALSLKYHPDKAALNGLTSEEAGSKMQEINLAYACINDGGSSDDDGFGGLASMKTSLREPDTYAVVSVPIDTLLTKESIETEITGIAKVLSKSFPAKDFFHPSKSRSVFLGEGHFQSPNPTDLVVALNVLPAKLNDQGASLSFNAMGEFVLQIPQSTFSLDIPILGIYYTNGQLYEGDDSPLRNVQCFSKGSASQNCVEISKFLQQKVASFGTVDPVIRLEMV